MAQITNEPVAIICTSGTAVLNFGPAVAEAFYQNIPLLLLTADRPPEWVDQGNGQTIRQSGIFKSHVKKDYDLPEDYTHKDAQWFVERTINEAIDLTKSEPKGPVHVNVPLREPLYPKPNQEITFSPNVRIINTVSASKNLAEETWSEIVRIIENHAKILIVSGQNKPNSQLNETLKAFTEKISSPIVAEIITNIYDNQNVIFHSDSILSPENQAQFTELQPEVLITFGNDLLSRNLKTFLRNSSPKFHFHIAERDELYDPLQTLTHRITISPTTFFDQLSKRVKTKTSNAFLEKWTKTDLEVETKIHGFIENEPFGEFSAIDLILKHFPKNGLLHLSNSMSVRYANILGAKSFLHKNIQVYSNRGTSGIDGCTSTALGAALQTDNIVLLITGDMAFLYDLNAFWHKHIPANLRIVVMNNHGGVIFRLIDGPKKLPELEEYFETVQPEISIEKAAELHQLKYRKTNDLNELDRLFSEFISPDFGASILEIETNGASNEAAFDRYKQSILLNN